MFTKHLLPALAALSVLIATLVVAQPRTAPAPSMAAVAACTVAEPAAHRGNWDGKYPENSRNGFRYSQNKDAQAWWETDVDWVDDKFVIRHDASQPYRMTLEEFLNDMAVDNVQALVELKWSPTPDQWTELMNMIWSAGIRQKLVLTSFVGADLLIAEQKDPTIRRGLIASTGYQTAASITQYHVKYYIKHSDSITYARMQEWQGAGLTVIPWSDHLSNNPGEWQRMNQYPIAALVTDTGAAYLSWAGQQGCGLAKR